MPMERKTELHQKFVVKPEAGINSIVKLAGEQKLEPTQAEVSELITTIDVDEEFDDIDLDAVALAACTGDERESRSYLAVDRCLSCFEVISQRPLHHRCNEPNQNPPFRWTSSRIYPRKGWSLGEMHSKLVK